MIGSRIKPVQPERFVVECKRCRRTVPAGITEWSYSAITVRCPLCGELRQYRPAEVYLGHVDQRVIQQWRAKKRAC
jgi:hypothetical protein